MAGLVAERSMGRPFADLADSLVFRPLRMTRSTFRPTIAAKYEFAQSHVGPATAVGQAQPTPFNAVDAPSGFLHSTAGDLSRLAIALMGSGVLDGKRVLAADAVRSATSGHVPIPGEPFLRYGYGMEVDSVAGHRTWQKSGHMPGYSALVTMWPNEAFAVIVLANRRTLLTDSVTVRAADIVRGIRSPPTAAYGVLRDPTAAERAELVGTYKNGSVNVVVADTNGALQVRLLRLTIPAHLTSDGSRIIGAASAVTPAQAFVIVRDAGGSVRYLYRDNARAYAKQP
jgi:CubicO group peptidase (beta-lactamase class C family)